MFRRILSVAAAVTAVAMPTYVVFTYRREITTWMLNIGRDNLGTQIASDCIRSQFNDTPMVEAKKVKHHTHGDAAASRSSAALFAEALASSVGLDTFYVQQSKADQRHGYDGNRTYYWAKDVQVEPSFQQVRPDTLRVLVDVDYYIDMPEYLASSVGPTLLYTIVPTTVAEEGDKGTCFTFNADNEIEMSVSGGGSYKHRLWNYNQDHCKVHVSSWLGLWRTTAVYLIDKRMIDKHRALVMLTPIGRWTGFLLPWIAEVLYGLCLRRLSVVMGKFLRLRVIDSEGVKVSTARVGSFKCATIAAAKDDVIASAGRVTKVSLSPAQVESYLPPGSKDEAVVLCEYHRQATEEKPDTVYPTDYGVRSYQFYPSTFDAGAKHGMTAFMPPIIDECYAPDDTAGNEHRCVKGRIVDVASNVPATPLLNTLMDEFVELLFPEPHVLVPADWDDVWERQDRPSQQHILEVAAVTGDESDIIKMFMKKEAYAEVKDPRPISQVPGKAKMLYSRYMYSFSEHIKKQPWYAFGKTPREIAVAVAALAAKSLSLANTDFNRFDGRVSGVFRGVEQKATMRGFRREYHTELFELQRKMFGKRGVTKHGIKYQNGWNRCSGAPETAVFNSLDNAFTDYVAKRITRIDGVYPTPKEAWAMLGLYGGDDGLTPNPVESRLVKAAEMVGQKIKVEIVNRGDTGVKFLARVYGPNVWYGQLDSCCDLPRQLSKFHATPNLPEGITPWDRLLEKCRGFYLSDRNTPIIGDIARAVLHLEADINNKPHTTEAIEKDAAELRQYAKTIRPWASMVAVDDQYPNDYHDWMKAYAEKSLPGFDMERLRSHLRRVKVPEDFTKRMPLCMEPKRIEPAAVAAVVRDEIVRPVEDKGKGKKKESQKSMKSRKRAADYKAKQPRETSRSNLPIVKPPSMSGQDKYSDE